MKITYYGHSCFGIQLAGKKLIVDPFITPNPLASNIDVNAIGADIILLTHGHADHVADAAQIAKNTGGTIISTYEVVDWFGQQKIEGHPLNHGGKLTLDGLTLKCVNAIHSSTLPDGTPGGNPAGFVIWGDGKCIYIAGDTALTLDMQLIPRICPPLDLAILPIGDNFTMGVDDAVMAADFVQCPQVLGCHYDTFPPIAIDKEKAKRAFSDNGKELILMEIGATREF